MARRSQFESWFYTIVDDLLELAYDQSYPLGGFKSTNELADHAGLSHQTVRKLELKLTHEPRLRTIYKLAKVVNADLRLWGLPKKQIKKRRAA